jgi:ATP-dependent DNA helicase RecQ
MSSPEKAVTILRQVFGYQTFRPLQTQIIESVLGGCDTLALLPTGGGKSLCYQIPGLVLGGTTLVISPLIALMEDQVRALLKRGVRAAFLSSQQDSSEQQQILETAGRGEWQFLYLAPERLKSPAFLALSKTLKFSLIAVDEAHCISSWGHDFRPNYRLIAAFYSQLQHRPAVIALTATATAQVQRDIINNLKLCRPQVFAQPFRRPNLRFWARSCNHTHHKKLLFFQLLRNLKGAGVVYALTREGCVQLASQLRAVSWQVGVYHGGLSSAERSQVLDAFLNNQIEVVVATNAFGMGVDKPNVRWVIHWQTPANLENYYQEAGRAGRDGQPSDCFLLFSKEDVEIHHQIWAGSETKPSQELQQIRLHKLDQMLQYVASKNCRENVILKYFDQPTTRTGCGHCDHCQNWQVPVSNKQQAQLNFLAKVATKIQLPQGIYLSLNLRQALVVLGEKNKLRNIPGIGPGFWSKIQPFFRN